MLTCGKDLTCCGIAMCACGLNITPSSGFLPDTSSDISIQACHLGLQIAEVEGGPGDPAFLRRF